MPRNRESTELIVVGVIGIVVFVVLGFIILQELPSDALPVVVFPTRIPAAAQTASLAVPTLTTTPVPPTEVPLPAVATVQPTTCVDGMRLVQHLSYDPQDVLSPHTFRPNRQFTKRWRIQNTGTCLWDPGYSLVYAGGNHPAAHMHGAMIVIHGRTYPSQTYDVEVKLISPPEAGLYQGYWRMRNATGTYFGDRLPVVVSVVAPLPPTREPTWTPYPQTTIQFSVDRGRIVAGECAVLTWFVSNAQAAYFYQEGQAWESNGVTFTGQRQACPLQTTTYYLRVVRPSGWVESRSLTVHVVQPPEPPQITRFTVEPMQVSVGDCVTLRWEVQGQDMHIRILRDGGVLWDGLPWFGSLSDCLTGVGQSVYRLEASGPGGSASMQRIVYVGTAPGPGPATLSGTSWQVLAIGNSVPLGLPPTVIFGQQNANGQGTVSGWGSCNSYSAVYQQTGSLLTIGSVTTGDNACTPEMVAQEQALLDALQATASFTRNGGQLTLKSSIGWVVLNLAAIEAAAP